MTSSMNANLPTPSDLRTANQARITWTILAALVFLCSVEQVLVLAQSGAHVFPVPSQSKAYVVAAASHYLFLLFLLQAMVTLQHMRLARIPPFPFGFTEAVRSVSGFRILTDRLLVWIVPVLLVVFFARMLTYEVQNIQTGEIVVSSAREHLMPNQELLSKTFDINYAGTHFMLSADDVMDEEKKRVSYFPVFAPYALLIEALVAIWYAWKIERTRRWTEEISPPGDRVGPVAIFISYRRSDTAYVVDRLSQTLASEFGRASVFRDLDAIKLGAPLDDRIEKAIANASVVLAVIGKEWLREQRNATEETHEDWVVRELSLAIENKRPLIPVLVKPATLPDEHNLPVQIRSLSHLNGLELNPDPYYSVDLNRLVSSVRGILDEAKGKAADGGMVPPSTGGD